MKLLQYHSFYLVGIKGVAMTSLAQILLDAGKEIRGSDVPEAFVTQELLDTLQVTIDTSFEAPIPESTECVVYTAAHNGQFNPQVKAAQAAGIPCLSQAEAVAAFFNAKQGIAVCGVGGKSTTSAMITWILEKTGKKPSFSVGVGKIIGMKKTGAWRDESQYFVAEADEYVIDPSAPSRGEAITPRFSFMQPQITVCTNFAWDHPDVYTSISDTAAAYRSFFAQIKPEGTLIVNAKDRGTVPTEAAEQVLYMGSDPEQADFGIMTEKTEAADGRTSTVLRDHTTQTEYLLTLQLPGVYNLENAAFAVLACRVAGVSVADSCAVLASFQSTQRRYEKIGEKHGITYYDDYAHHPSEVSNVIDATVAWFPERRVVFAFQPHTFSRTKQLFTEFSQSFYNAKELILLDIFASAREAADDSITSQMLADAVAERHPDHNIQVAHSIPELAQMLKETLKPGDICLTLGAGDIYKVHEYIE